MMLDTPTISHQPPTPPGSPNPSPASSSPSSPHPAVSDGGVVRAELAQQANEVCQLVAKANRAPHGLHADELRRLLSDIHSLHLLAQQLSSTSTTTTSSSSLTTPTPSRGIAKKKPTHHASVLSRPLAFTSSSSSSSSSSAWCATSSPPAPTTTSSAATTAPRACHTPIRPRGHPLPMTATTTSTAGTNGSSSSCLSPEIGGGPRACANCGTSSTVQWRCGADGKPSLCNACGLRYRYNLKKKALYEDIAVVRAMTQRSPPFAQHNISGHVGHNHLHSTTSSASASPASSGFSSPSASRSPSPPPPAPAVVPTATAAVTAGCPPRPAPVPSTTAAISAPAEASSEARRSNIYSLLN